MLLSAMRATEILPFHSMYDPADASVAPTLLGSSIYPPLRACFQCLQFNVGFWMITPAIANKCFRLTTKQLKTVPNFYNIPGIYSVKTRASHLSQVRRLVSVNQVKQLPVKIHGSLEMIANLALKGTRNAKQKRLIGRLREVSPELPGQHIFREPESGLPVVDRFAGVASMPIPHLSIPVSETTGAECAHADWGCACRGCVETYRLWKDGELPASIISQCVPPGAETHRSRFLALSVALSRLYSEDGISEHFASCYGAQKLFAQLM